MTKYERIPNDVWAYFSEKYKAADFTIVPGHHPTFQTKEEVDDWFADMECVSGFIDELRKTDAVGGDGG